jgi:hypothetical protein
MDRSERLQQLWEAMESCRIGSDDLSDPEFADVAAELANDPDLRAKFERLQCTDGLIKAVFVNVPVPPGLGDRMTLRLADRLSRPIAETASEAEATAAPVPPAPLQKTSKRFSGRRLLIGMTALAAAAGLFTAVWIETHPPRVDTPTSVIDEAMDFFGRDNEPVGELVSHLPPPAGFPMSSDIVRFRELRWRRVQNFLGGSAVAYDLPTNGGRATLYVVNRNVAGLPSSPPERPILSTGGKSAGAWQAGDTLYVLVVDDRAGPYSSYLDQSRGPLT